MTLLEIPPLDEEEWNTLMANLEKGQSEEQTKAIELALNAKEIPLTDW